MGPLAVRRATRRFRRHGAAVFAVLALGCAIAVHHGGVPMQSMHHDGAMGTAIELCIGMFVSIGTAVAAVASALIALGRWRPPSEIRPSGLSGALAWPETRARAGPILLSLFCVRRR